MRLIDADKLWKAITTRTEEYCDLADLIEIIETQLERLRDRASKMLDFGEGVEQIIKEWLNEQ